MEKIAFILLFFSPLLMLGQENTGTFKIRKASDSFETVETEDYTINRNPSYSGGKEAYADFFKNNLKYKTIKRSINQFNEEAVSVNFIVDSLGNITNITPFSGVHPYTTELIRVIKLMPKWVPGKKDSKNINHPMGISLTFIKE